MQLSDYDSFPSDLPVVIEEESFLYPFMISPIFLNSEESIRAASYALENDSLLMVVTSKNRNEELSLENAYEYGVIGNVMRKVAFPDGRVKILFQGLAKGRIISPVSTNPLIATVDIQEARCSECTNIDHIVSILFEKVKQLSRINNNITPDLMQTVEENSDTDRIIDIIASMLKLKNEHAHELYSMDILENRLFRLIDYIAEELESSKIEREIKNKVNSKIEKINKEYFLKEQLKQIQKELGTDNQRDEEIEEYQAKLEAKKPFLDKEAYKEINKQIERFSKMHPDSSDASMTQSYLDWVLEIPFGEYSSKKLSIKDVEQQLDEDHYSLKKPKDRIVEYFAVKELLQKRAIKEKDKQGAILCFAGPPGVGKTSLANSISKALGRKLVRIALGGMEDVNELRGHRRTYIGAMPGRVVQGLIEAKEMDPVIVLDEIDKVAKSHRGDPTAVMLEILDPEQNDTFRDYYLNFNIDLSKAIFIATANEVGYIPAPLRDRMEFIYISSYTPQEKYQIAKKYLLPQELQKHGLETGEVSVTKGAMEKIIANYTREAGVRNLRRQLATLSRKSAKAILADEGEQKINITVSNLPKYLDKTVFEIDETEKKARIGVVNGLAWTAVGGDVLKVEAIKLNGKGIMQITGSLGDVMKESARIAHSVVKLLIDNKKLKIDLSRIKQTDKDKKPSRSEAYSRYDLHLHVPDGATPKDGPSAGITMITAISSILTDTPVRSDVAMTGEVNLSGKVTPIGGLKEKLIAAHKAKIKTAIIPQKNYERDLEDIPSEVKRSMEIIGVKSVEEVLKIALLDE
jgi:ATP-dependent Lon protease